MQFGITSGRDYCSPDSGCSNLGKNSLADNHSFVDSCCIEGLHKLRQVVQGKQEQATKKLMM